ncbi:MAG: 4-(cytidine 5'-diphospho)-2-C-methyl-D-erythritol kinase [Acidimicrobiales bacterium]
MAKADRTLAPAKLTRTFRVTGRRDDGYHLVEAEMVALDLADELEFAEGEGLDVVDAIRWIGPGQAEATLAAVPVGENLVVRALGLVGRTAHVRLVKRIPPGAGLGGGSSDAAAVLRWAGVRDHRLASRLGADVPFCLLGGRARVRGIGEIVEPLVPADVTVVLVTPAFGVSTTAVYAAFDEVGAPPRGASMNDLEKAALVVEPRLARYRDLLAEASQQRPMLAGSGATWFVESEPRRAPRIAGEVRDAIVSTGLRAVIEIARAVG